jgi:glycerophosphoryl diester phosphodiesterase
MTENEKYYAHRGVSGLYVENSLSAFKNAISLGFRGAELDVHLSKDNEVIVHHDFSLKSAYCKKIKGDFISSSDKLKINELTLKDIKSYEIGYVNPDHEYFKKRPLITNVKNEKIPTLDEVIELVSRESTDFILIIEIKTHLLRSKDKSWMLLVDKVLEVLACHDFINRVRFCSFNWNTLLYIKSKIPEAVLLFTTYPLSWFKSEKIPLSDIPPNKKYLEKLRYSYVNGASWLASFKPESLEKFPEMIKEAGGSAWFCYHTDLTISFIQKCHQIGLEIGGWSVNFQAEKNSKSSLMNSVDFLCVDYPPN